MAKPTHAYVIVYFKDQNGAIKIISGREQAVFKKGLGQLRNVDHRVADVIISKEVLLDANGANETFRINRNLSGVLLIGRTALPGGKREGKETIEEAAIRELREEFKLNGIGSTELNFLVQKSFDTKRCENYYMLDVTKHLPDPQAFVGKFNRNPSAEKRELEIITVNELITRLETPDQKDKEFIEAEMAKLVKDFCDGLARSTRKTIDAGARAKLKDDLVQYQLGRKFTHPEAARDFKATFVDAPLSGLLDQTLLSPPAQQNAGPTLLSSPVAHHRLEQG